MSTDINIATKGVRMKLRPHAFGLASSCTTLIVYIVGAITIKLFPGSALQIAAPLVQLNRFKLIKYLKPFFGFSPISFVISIAEIAVYSYITSFLIAVLYNFFAGHYSKKNKPV